MDGEIHEVTTNNFEQMCMYTPDFFYDNPEMQLKDIYSLLRYKQINKAFALEELERAVESLDEAHPLTPIVKNIVYLGLPASLKKVFAEKNGKENKKLPAPDIDKQGE